VNDHYMVKWEGEGGDTHYGTVDAYSEDAQELRERKVLLIDDAVLHLQYEVPEASVTDIPFSWSQPDEYTSYVTSAFNAAVARAASLGKGLKPGKLLRTQVGDGYAWYIVTKVTRTQANIEWRGFCPDHWYDQVLGAGGSFDRSIIARLVQQREYVYKHQPQTEAFATKEQQDEG